MIEHDKQHYELEDCPVPGNSSNIPLYKDDDEPVRRFYLLKAYTCAVCGVLFMATNKIVHRYCSSACKSRAAGYTKENVQFTTSDYNIAKGNLSDQDFLRLCKTVVEHAGYSVQLKGG